MCCLAELGSRSMLAAFAMEANSSHLKIFLIFTYTYHLPFMEWKQ